MHANREYSVREVPLLPEASGSLAQIFADIFGGPQGSQTERKESFLLETSARIESLGPEKPNVA